MRIANLSGRLVLIVDGLAVDVEQAAGGKFGPDPAGVFERWGEFQEWAAVAARGGLPAGVGFDPARLGPPSPAPRQVFAAGLNYRDHAAESGFDAPQGLPPIFTKFPSCLSGPVTEVSLPVEGHTDWEVEVVAIIGRRAHHIEEAQAWSHVAGLSVGQDISERIVQLAGPAPQFGLGKSYPGFGPVGPWLVTPDEFDDPDDLELTCAINGEQVQKGRTRDLIFSVPALIARLSAITPLLPGDLVFTGTPAGVGLGRSPQRWLVPGDELVSTVEGIGELRQRFVA